MKRGRPKSLLARVSDETWEEIHQTIRYGNRAWRLIRLRKLPVAAAQRVQAFDRLWNKLWARNEGKPPEREKWLPKRDQLLRRLRPRRVMSKQWVCLWHELSEQIENALVTRDDDFLNDLAKAIRGEAKREPFAKFTTKVLALRKKKRNATASEIFATLDRAGLVKPESNGLKVAGRYFGNKQDALDAIHDVADKVEHELARRVKP